MQTLTKFWETNSDAIWVSLITGFIFFVLGPIGVWFSGRKIKREKIRKAMETLLDVVEEMLVSGESIPAWKIPTLFRAVESENGVSLAEVYDHDDLFDDVILRFSKSKHLDPNQKTKYAETVEELRVSMKKATETKQARPILPSYIKTIENLREEIKKGEKEKALGHLAHLQDRITRDREIDIFNPFRLYVRIARQKPKMAIAVSVITLIIYGFLVQFMLRSINDKEPNKAVQPTPTAGTDAAAQPPRQP